MPALFSDLKGIRQCIEQELQGGRNSRLLGGWLTNPVGSAELKVGSVDIQKAVNECNAGKEAKRYSPGRWKKFSNRVWRNRKSSSR